MAYVPGFQYDLFVSYASDDDDGRLAQFVKDLRSYLARDSWKRVFFSTAGLESLAA